MEKFDLSGMSIYDISKLGKSTIDKLSKSDLSRVTSRLVSAMNKRIRRLSKTEVGRLSPTYQAYERRISKHKEGYREGFYSVKGKSYQELKDLYKQLSSSLTHKTTLESGEDVEITSVRGWKKHRQEVLDNIGYDFQNDYDREKKFWELYRKFQETEPSYKAYRKNVSDKVLSFIANEIGSDYTDSKENIEKIKNRVDELYEKVKGEEYDKEFETGTSQFFTDGGNV